MAEVVTEVIDELEVENVRPVTPDREALEAISRAVEDRAQIVASTQEELLQAQLNQDIIEEQEFYAEVKGKNSYQTTWLTIQTLVFIHK